MEHTAIVLRHVARTAMACRLQASVKLDLTVRNCTIN